MARGYAVSKKDLSKILYRSDDFNENDIVSKVDLSDDTVLLLSGKDPITEDLERRLEEAESANIAKETFLSNMSHDIRTPMNAIIGMTALAKKHIDEKSRLIDSLNKIDTASLHLLSLINEVLDMSRINSGKLQIANELFSLSDLIHDTVTIIKPQMAQKGHEFELHIDNIEYEDLYGDIQRLRQIYVNIINNAVKYTNNNGHISVSFSEEKKDGSCVLLFNCSDNGIGMSEEFIKKIYDPFERAGNSTISGIEGTGLGMSIVQKLVQAMGGEINIDSKVDEGTSVTIRIPFLYSEPAIAANALQGKRFLLLMKDSKSCEVLEKYLKEYQVEYERTTDFSSMVSALTEADFSQKPYDCFLLGHVDDSTGNSLDMASYIHRSNPDTPIVLISDDDWEKIEYDANRSGIEHFIPIPFFRKSLINALDTVLSGQQGSSSSSRIDLSGKNILLVEDNLINREIALEILRSTGARIDTAENGKEAIERFENTDEGFYNIILMDIQMPVMDGYSATRNIRNLSRTDGKTVKIYAMSANIFAEDIAKAREAGMDGHIAKPIDINKLMQTLKQA